MSKLLSLPADPAEQSVPQKTEFERYQLDEDQVAILQEVGLWKKIELSEEDDAFTAGLLHDMGKVTMLMCLEDSLELILALIESDVQEAPGIRQAVVQGCNRDRTHADEGYRPSGDRRQVGGEVGSH